MLQITPLPAFDDNYIWLLSDAALGRCAVVDPGDAAPVLEWLAAHPQMRLEAILITHHHGDHTGGIAALKAATQATVYGPALENIPGRDIALEDGQSLEVLGHAWQIMHVPGHTAGHIALYADSVAEGVLFCGDTLFSAGCGRLFEGTAAQMHASLQRLAALPATTAVYCTHEYTLSNLRFALAVEPQNQALRDYQQTAAAQRAAGQPTLPSSLARERAINPFLRGNQPAIRQQLAAERGQLPGSDAEAFALLRAWKDSF